MFRNYPNYGTKDVLSVFVLFASMILLFVPISVRTISVARSTFLSTLCESLLILLKTTIRYQVTDFKGMLRRLIYIEMISCSISRIENLIVSKIFGQFLSNRNHITFHDRLIYFTLDLSWHIPLP